MRRFFRLFSRYLLVVMLTTVFSPSFAGEALGIAAAGSEGHTHHASHEDSSVATTTDLADLAALPCTDCPEHMDHDAALAADLAGCDRDVDHHCCPGHVLGHFAGVLVSGPALPAADNVGTTPAHSAQPFSSRSGDGLERPPRAAA